MSINTRRAAQVKCAKPHEEGESCGPLREGEEKGFLGTLLVGVKIQVN